MKHIASPALFLIGLFFVFTPSSAFALTTINSCSDLQDINNNLSEDYVLGQNIDCTGHDPDADGSGFDPIGAPSSAFTGSLDGAGYTVSGLTISHSGTDDIALFDALNGATIENITFSSPSITGGRRAAVLAGSASGASVLDSITISSPTVSGTDYVGGLVGNIAIGTSVISNTVLTSVDIDATSSYIGGMVGYLGTATITDSAVTGSITSSGGQFHGGITGINQNGSVGRRLYFNGTLSGIDRVGGITGQTNSGATALEDVMVRGSVAGGSYVGGIIGWQFGIVLRRGYSTADVTGDDAGTNGGTVGSGASCSDVFLDNSVSDTSGGCHTSKDTADMIDVATYTDETTVGLTSAWDFVDNPNDDAADNDYWDIDPSVNDGYPTLVDTFSATVEEAEEEESSSSGRSRWDRLRFLDPTIGQIEEEPVAEEIEEVEEVEEVEVLDNVVEEEEIEAVEGHEDSIETEPEVSYSFAPGALVRGESHNAVYFVDEEYRRRPFMTSAIYFTHHDSFDDVQFITDSKLATLKMGIPMLPSEYSPFTVDTFSDFYVLESEEGTRSMRSFSEGQLEVAFGDDWSLLVINLPITLWQYLPW